MDTLNVGARHLTDDEAAAYLDRGLPAVELDRIEAHLADCGACRAELVALRRLLDLPVERPRRSRTVPAAAALAAIAAGLAALLIAEPTLRQPAAGVDTLRSVEPTAAAGAPGRIVVTQPPAGETVAADRIVFEWRAVEAGAVYQLTLVDDGGATVWSARTEATRVQLPDGTRLTAARSYFWRVDALLGDGRSATSGTQRVAVRR